MGSTALPCHWRQCPDFWWSSGFCSTKLTAGFAFIVNQARASRVNVCSGLWPMVMVLLRFGQFFFIQDALSWRSVLSVLETSMSTPTVEICKLRWRHFSGIQFGQNCLFSYKMLKRTDPAEFNNNNNILIIIYTYMAPYPTSSCSLALQTKMSINMINLVH